MNYRIAVAAAVTAFVVGVVLVSTRGEDGDSFGVALLGGLVFAVVVGVLVGVWVWAMD